MRATTRVAPTRWTLRGAPPKPTNRYDVGAPLVGALLWPSPPVSSRRNEAIDRSAPLSGATGDDTYPATKTP